MQFAVSFFSFFFLGGLSLMIPVWSSACTLNNATLSWASDDGGEIFINGNLANACPDGCWVGVNNITIPIAWLNTTGDNVLAAYTYSSDTVYSASSWLLTLNYSDCSSTYVMPGSCVLEEYLNDPNAASSGLPTDFPVGWNNTGFVDSSWSAPGTIGLVPTIYPEDETIPNPLGGVSLGYGEPRIGSRSTLGMLTCTASTSSWGFQPAQLSPQPPPLPPCLPLDVLLKVGMEVTRFSPMSAAGPVPLRFPQSL